METLSTEKIFPFPFVPFSSSTTLQNNAISNTDTDFFSKHLSPVI